MKKIVMTVCALAVVVAVAAATFAAVINSDVSGVNIKESISVEIENGASGNGIVKMLKEAGAIKYPKIFKMKAEKAALLTKFKPGKAVIEPEMSYDEIIRLLASDGRAAVKVTIPEGYEIYRIADKLEQLGIVTKEEFYAAAKAEDYDYKFLKNLPKRENALEGYLFPDTYIVSENISAHDMIDMMLAEFDKCFSEEYYKRADELGMSVDEIVTLASIVERETNAPDERAKVAGVFYNRLGDGMKLQSCATVEYVLEERKAKLSNADLAIDSKYNTYKYSGLPIGPIASPGAECIKAALYPEKTTARYFVLGKDGKHVFSETYSAHLAAKKKAES